MKNYSDIAFDEYSAKVLEVEDMTQYYGICPECHKERSLYQQEDFVCSACFYGGLR